MLQQAYLALFTLKEYTRATYLYMEILAVATVLFISQDHFWLIDMQYTYITLGILALCLAVITTTKLTNRETNPRIYILMTKKISRSQYLMGKFITIFLLDAAVLFGMYLLAFRFTLVNTQVSFFEGIVRLVPILFVLMISIIVILLVSPLLNNAYYFILGISFLMVSGFYQPPKQFSYFLPPIQQLIKGSFTKSLADMKFEFLLAGFYIVVFGVLTMIIFKKKELNYEQN